MMYQSAGLQSEAPKAKPFLGSFAEDIIADIRAKRELEEGDYALAGKEGITIKSPGRIDNYA
jgi:hypothetical protein